jgi:hypothetical protein
VRIPGGVDNGTVAPDGGLRDFAISGVHLDDGGPIRARRKCRVDPLGVINSPLQAPKTTRFPSFDHSGLSPDATRTRSVAFASRMLRPPFRSNTIRFPWGENDPFDAFHTNSAALVPSGWMVNSLGPLRVTTV